MPAIKSAASVFTGVTTSQTSAVVDCSADYAQQLYVDIVVVGTPTAAASVQPQWSPDGGTTYYNGPTLSTSLVAGTYDFVVDVPVTATRVKVVFAAQTGGTSSTCTAQLGQVTGL